jgi:hypothetical protein
MVFEPLRPLSFPRNSWELRRAGERTHRRIEGRNECVCKDLKAAAIHYSVRTGRGDKEPDFRDYHACLKAKRSFLWHDRTKP